MATISSLGIGSGLDVNSIISKLVDLEKQPLTSLKAKATFVQAQITEFGQIQSQFSALNDVVGRIASPTAWVARSSSSSNTNAATISATTTAQATSFSLDVDALAQAQSVASGTLTAGAAVGAGTLTLRLGSWNVGATAFTPATGSSDVPITISATDKVSDVAAKINAANAGVTATAFNDGTSDRLLIKSNATGVTGGFRIQATDSDGTNTDDAGLSRLAFDPATLNPLTSATFGMAGAGIPTQYGQDAKARINGLAVTSSTNTLTGNIPGVTINLLATTTTGYGTGSEVKAPIAMSVSNDTTQSVKNVQDFVTAYNTLSQSLSSMTAYDASTKTAGPFQGDSVIVGLQNVLRSMLGSVNNTGGAYQRLSDVGVSFQRDGTLAIDSVKLGAAANNGDALQQFFTATSSNPLTKGFAVKLAAFTQGALDSTSGLLTNEAGALQRQLSSNSKEQDNVNQHVANVQAQLQKQYSALDATMGSLSALNAYVTQQVTLWNKPSA
jgi:flagellar hook-associated protein 2